MVEGRCRSTRRSIGVRDVHDFPGPGEARGNQQSIGTRSDLCRVRTVAAAPGDFARLLDPSQTPRSRSTSRQRLGRSAVSFAMGGMSLLASDQASYINGADIQVDGGLAQV